MLKVEKLAKTIPTYQLTPMGPLPSVFDPDGIYPYQSYCRTSDTSKLKNYSFIQLENIHICVLICPDLGGKVYSIVLKSSGKEVLYVPGVIKPSRILPRFSFVAGGIEVSFPISHTPSQNETICHEIIEDNDRIHVCVGETELRYGMQWTVEFSLGEGDHFLTQRTVFHNPTSKAHPWMSWSNAAVPAYPDTEFHFPNGSVLEHSDRIKTIDWENDGPKNNADIKHMSGYFWQNQNCNAFGCFSPSGGVGLYHIAEKTSVPGIKLWSYGIGRDLRWSYLSSSKRQSYLEIQAGPIKDQSLKNELDLGEKHAHIEFWLPAENGLDIKALKIQDLFLRPLSAVTLFPFARKEEVMVWNKLIESFENQDITQAPDPPAIKDFRWAPSGVVNLDQPFQWFINHAESPDKSVWQLYYGVWLLGSSRINEALPVLRELETDMANAILGRMYFYQGYEHEAMKCYESISDEALQQHPLIIIERDKALAKIGTEAFQIRMRWLDKLRPLHDERLIERMISLLIDMKRYDEAKAMLTNTKFQLIHQRYERKKLWNRLCEEINAKVAPYPENLGEDNLAQFGAYREFDE